MSPHERIRKNNCLNITYKFFFQIPEDLNAFKETTKNDFAIVTINPDVPH